MELRGLTAAVTSFRHNFSDVVNAPASEFAIGVDPDGNTQCNNFWDPRSDPGLLVTFLKLTLEYLDVAWVADQTSIHICLSQGVKLDYNDLAGNNHKKLTEIRIPEGAVRALVCSAMRRETWLEAGSLSFDMGVDLYSSPTGWREAAKAQTAFVATQDALTRRAWFLYEKSPDFQGSREHVLLYPLGVLLTVHSYYWGVPLGHVLASRQAPKPVFPCETCSWSRHWLSVTKGANAASYWVSQKSRI